jgi:hypothetical protein
LAILIWLPLGTVTAALSRKLVEGATVQGWNAAYGALSIAFPGRLEPKL